MRELQQIDVALETVAGQDGESLVFEAPSGGGKTRLLREVHVRAQTAGLVVAVAQGGRDSGGYVTFRELAQQLLRQRREIALQAAEEAGPWLGHAIPELQLESIDPSNQPDQDRVNVQRALVTWIETFGRLNPVAVVVDDIQRADEPRPWPSSRMPGRPQCSLPARFERTKTCGHWLRLRR